MKKIVRRTVGKKKPAAAPVEEAVTDQVETNEAEEQQEEEQAAPKKTVKRVVRGKTAPKAAAPAEEQEEEQQEEEQEEAPAKKAAPKKAAKKAPAKKVVKKAAPAEEQEDEDEEDDSGKGNFGFRSQRSAAPKKELKPGDRMPLERFYDQLLANFQEEMPSLGMTRKTEAKAVLEVVEQTLSDTLQNYSMKFLGTMFKSITNGARLSKVPSVEGRYTLVPEHQALKMVSIRLSDVPNIDVFAEETDEGTIYTAGTWDAKKGVIVADEAYQQQLDEYLDGLEEAE